MEFPQNTRTDRRLCGFEVLHLIQNHCKHDSECLPSAYQLLTSMRDSLSSDEQLAKDLLDFLGQSTLSGKPRAKTLKKYQDYIQYGRSTLKKLFPNSSISSLNISSEILADQKRRFEKN